MSPPVIGLPPSGSSTALLPHGSLTTTEAQELLVSRSLPGAYRLEGTLLESTIASTIERAVRWRVSPDRLEPSQVTDVHHEPVIWGGNILNEYEHFMSSSVSRTWLALPKPDFDGLPVVFSRPRYSQLGSTPRNPELVREWLSAFDVREIELPQEGAVRFTKMRLPEPAWRMGAWIAPEMRDIHLHARRGLDMPSTPRHDVLWLSNSHLESELRPYDEALLEWLLGDLVTALALGAMPLVDQVGLLESCRQVVGVASGAFHTLLLTRDTPDCLYLSRDLGHPVLLAQHQLLDRKAVFTPALAHTTQMRRARSQGRPYPGGYRVLVPEALRALASVLPGLIDDSRLAAFAHPGRKARAALGDRLDNTVMRVLLDPFSFDQRLALGELFEDRGLVRCAAEQYVMTGQLTEDRDQAEKAALCLQRIRR